MSDASQRVDAYSRELTLPWRQGISPAERVWMLPYPPGDERRMRAQVGRLDLATRQSGRSWVLHDVTDAFGRWLAHHEYAEAFVTDPTDLTSSVLEEFEAHVATGLRAELTDPGTGEDTVVALVGVGALYPFVRVSRLVQAVADDIRGRLLVLFPGRFDPAGHTYRLLDARDGFNYRALAILPTKD
ncbi:BREX protein BrxB domain-containing protein [Cellulomonas sp. PSBB021]|uniref:BREX protein BrxB domain-containing protein n=1 Tax=Cellulomonas sp. PSBB021 TaxID=2003551 RepID=UPI000B8D1C95|nr:BREX protein BrxB domain-containing protein [Cellulomonas sp. PSBB021]ASR55536.1 hypothetical protein CBP52_11040 [Cellulomonas sp. PSBB021]